MSDIALSTDLQKVSIMLKAMINSLCEEGHEWYPEAIGREKDGPNVIELGIAIKVLDEYADGHPKEITIADQ